MAYCAFCSRLLDHIVTHAQPSLTADHNSWELEKDCDFKDSMAQCALCRFVYQCLQEQVGNRSSSLDGEGKLRNMRLVNRYGPRYLEGRLDMPLCRIELHFPSLEYGEMTDFAVWAEIEDPAAATITTHFPIHKDGSEIDQTCALVGKKLYDCITSHPKCGQSNIPWTQPTLPTRALYVRNATSYHGRVSLLQTHGATGPYCALSHCWGPVDRQPIRTLAGNIQDHYSGISLAALPRTYQDAVILTQSLGIDYLWIDSLCIQQDDDDDWRREAASMGRLYQQATLVIAATGSKDPTGGLFICERSPQVSVQLPYARKGNSDAGMFNLAIRGASTRALSVFNEPLHERAWALQESYLARRIALFAPRGVDWRCDSCECDECGCTEDLGLHEHLDWFILLEVYSRRKLTRSSDRLPALQGIVSEEGRKRNDTFLREGVWEKEIPKHLLWYRTSVLALGDSALPSWSWAATEGSKNWICYSTGNNDVQFDYSCVVMQRLQPGHLSVSGGMVQPDGRWAEINTCCASRCHRHFQETLGVPLEFAQTRLLQKDDSIIGFAELDRNEGPSRFTDYGTLKLCIAGEIVNKRYTLKTSKPSEPSETSQPGLSDPCCLDNCIDFWRESDDIEYILLALVLEPVV